MSNIENRINELIEALRQSYPNAACELNYANNFELLVAVILSAQCTDRRVNEVTKELFKVASSPYAFANMGAKELEKLIYSCGFYRNKAANIISAAKDITERFNGEVPDTFDDLISLSGVGRKTANVMLSVAFNKDALAVDTHVYRVARRLSLSGSSTPEGVEKDLTAVFKGKGLSQVHHLLLFHGRYCCKSQRPECKICPVAGLCPTNLST